MSTDEQAVTLRAVVALLVRDVADMQLRLAKLERERANTLTGSIDGLDDVAFRVQVPAGWWAE